MSEAASSMLSKRPAGDDCHRPRRGELSCFFAALAQWSRPHIELVHRHPNAPVSHNGELRWDLGQITQQMDAGLRKCAEIATEGMRSIAADGWAVDYVRLNRNGSGHRRSFLLSR